MHLKKHLASAAVALALLIPAASTAMQAPASAPAKSADKSAKAPVTPPPSAQEISDNKSKGMVWVNTSTRVYHKDGADYGTTKRGKFMTEADAMKGGFRAAKEPNRKKAAAATAKTPTK